MLLYEHIEGERKLSSIPQNLRCSSQRKSLPKKESGLCYNDGTSRFSAVRHGSVEYTFDEAETGTVMFKDALGNQDRADYEKMKKK